MNLANSKLWKILLSFQSVIMDLINLLKIKMKLRSGTVYHMEETVSVKNLFISDIKKLCAFF